MNIKKIQQLLLMGCILMAASNASAIPTYTGGPYVGSSWSFSASASGIGSFDLVAVRISSGADVFESPAIRNISNLSWGMLLDGPTLASFAGPSVTSLNWDVFFAGNLPMSSPLELDWAFFNAQQLTVWTHWQMNEQGSLVGWQLNPVNGWQPSIDDVTPDIIPVPGALLLGGIGAGLVGWLRRRRTL